MKKIERKDIKFDNAMNKVFTKACITGDDEIQDTMFAYFYDSETDSFKFDGNEQHMFWLIRDLVNYDWLWIDESGKVDIKNANKPEIAKALRPFITTELGIQVNQSFVILSVK